MSIKFVRPIMSKSGKHKKYKTIKNYKAKSKQVVNPKKMVTVRPGRLHILFPERFRCTVTLSDFGYIASGTATNALTSVYMNYPYKPLLTPNPLPNLGLANTNTPTGLLSIWNVNVYQNCLVTNASMGIKYAPLNSGDGGMGSLGITNFATDADAVFFGSAPTCKMAPYGKGQLYSSQHSDKKDGWLKTSVALHEVYGLKNTEEMRAQGQNYSGTISAGGVYTFPNVNALFWQPIFGTYDSAVLISNLPYEINCSWTVECWGINFPELREA